MSIATIVSDITPFFTGCPGPVITAAVNWVFKDMQTNGVENPDQFDLCLEFGAKWRLYSMPSEKWTNLDVAESMRLQYLTARGKAKLEEANENHPPRTKVPEF